MPNRSRGTLLRHWEMLKLIPKEPASISTKDLCTKLKEFGYSVTKRTVERDVNSMVEAGFPLVVDDSEQPHLWSWSRQSNGFHAPRMNISDALLTVMAADTLIDLLPNVVSESLMSLKIEAEHTLNAAQSSNQLVSWREKVAIKSPTQQLIPPKVDEVVKTICYEALLHDEQLKISYLNIKSDTPAEYTINPLGMVQRGWMTYFVVTFSGHQDLRLIALNRVKEAERTFVPAVKPEGFSLTKYMEDGFADFGDGQIINVRAEISPTLHKYLLESKLSEDQTFDQSEGKIILNAKVAMTPQFAWWLKTWEEDIEIRSYHQTKIGI
jgi:predicted DNA-binding transcriptional regulator YafY